MKYLLVDFETNGLPNFNERARHPSQPHIVQAAALICDEAGTELERYEAIVKPEGWIIPPELTEIHGISNEHALAVGIPEIEVCAHLLERVKTTEAFVAYNSTFDKFIMRCGLRRFDLMQDSDDEWWKGLNVICAMRPMVNVCKLPGKKPGQFKYPKLQEAYTHAFKKPFAGAHGAMQDLQATKELFFWMKRDGIIS